MAPAGTREDIYLKHALKLEVIKSKGPPTVSIVPLFLAASSSRAEEGRFDFNHTDFRFYFAH